MPGGVTVNAENGKNIELLLNYENSLPGVKLTGYPQGLAQALYRMGYQAPEAPDKPGHLDNVAAALESDKNVLYRKNHIGQQVPKRVEEYIEDRQDFVVGAISDYFLSPALKIINGFNQGYQKSKKDGVESAEDFIAKIDAKYPLSGPPKDHEEKENAPSSTGIAPVSTLPGKSAPAYAGGFGNYAGGLGFGNYNNNMPGFFNYIINNAQSPSTAKANARKPASRKSPSRSKSTPKRSSRNRSNGSSGTTNNNTATATGNVVSVYVSEQQNYAPKIEKSPIKYIV